MSYVLNDVTNMPEMQSGKNGAAKVYDTTIHPGDMDAQDLRVTIPVWKRVRVTASGLVSGLTAGNVIGGFIIQSGANVTITPYDAVDASDATKLLWPTTGALSPGVLITPFTNAGTFASSASSALLLTAGLYLTLGGTTPALWVLYR